MQLKITGLENTTLPDNAKIVIENGFVEVFTDNNHEQIELESMDEVLIKN